MILLIDNYDSFSYNLYQYIGSIYPEIRVVRNDALTLKEIRQMKPEAIVLSPGPGRPENAGICEDVVRSLGPEIPILGICLGHQAICQVFGARITYAKELMHGKTSQVLLGDSPIFEGISSPAQVARYHSLAADPGDFPQVLKVTAQTGISCVRTAVPSGIGDDPGGKTYAEKFSADGRHCCTGGQL